MFTKTLKIFILGLLLVAPFVQTASALAIAYSINNKCVVRVLTFSASTARPENGSAVSVASGYVNVYVLQDSTFDYIVQDVSGFLIRSPNQAMYYDYSARTLLPGAYLGSSAQFTGSTKYLSVGSASLISNTAYDITGTTCQNGLPQSAVNPTFTVTTSFTGLATNPGVTGAGTYSANSNIAITAPNVTGYAVTGFQGECNGRSFNNPISYSANVYSYTITNIQSNCKVNVNYTLISVVLTTYKVSLSATTGGTVQSYYYGGSAGAGTASTTSTYYKNDRIVVTAIANSGYTFNGWAGSYAGKAISFDEYVSGDKTAQATFVPNTVVQGGNTGSYDVTFVVNPSAGGRFDEYTTGVYSPATSMTVTNQHYFRIVPYSGYVLTGYTSPNIPKATLDRLNTGGNYFTPSDLASTTGAVLTANLQYTGLANANGSETFDEPLAVSATAIFDKLLTSFTVDTGQTLGRSPYVIGSRCVSQVVSFTAKRAFSPGLGIYVPTSVTHNYTIYGVKGSDLSLEKVGSVYTFRSDPSDFIYSYDQDIQAGTYSQDDPKFTGADNSLTFINVVPISNVSYSCTDGTTDVSVAPYFVPGYGLMQGISYLTSLSTSLANIALNATTAGVASSTRIGVNNLVQKTLNMTMSQVNCSYGINQTLSEDLGCPVWLFNVDNHNLPYPYEKYRYVWVFSSKPIRELYHQNPVGVIGQYDLQLRNAEKTGSMGSYAVNTNGTTYTLYATRINLSTCRQIHAQDHWFKLAGAGWLTDYRECDPVVNANVLNGLLLDTGDWSGATSSPLFPQSLQIFGLYFTSGSVDFTKFNTTNFQQYIRNTVSNPKDLDLTLVTASDSDNVYSEYVATSTIPGYYDAPVYHATTTVATTTAIQATGGTISISGSTIIHKFTSSGTFTPSATSSFTSVSTLVLGGGGGGGAGNGGGGGGGAGELQLDTSHSVATTSPFTITVGAGGSGSGTDGVNGTNGSNSVFDTITALGGGGGGTHANGNTGGSGGGGGAVTSSWTGGSASCSTTGGGSVYCFGGGTGFPTSNYGAGGGGGAGAVGGSGSGTAGGNGGAGVSSSLSGSSVTYAGGGGGGKSGSATPGTGGSGGGGNGGSTTGFNGTANTGGGGGGGSDGYAQGGTGGSGLVIITYSGNATTTIPGYYDAPVYHATTTVNGFYRNATSSTDLVTSATGDKVNGLNTFSNETFSTAFTTTIGQSPILTGLDTNIKAMYSYTECVNSSRYGLFGYVMCAFMSAGMQLFSLLAIPSSESLNTFQKMMNDRITANSSIFSTMMSIPLRTANYGNLLWSPATSTVLTLGLNSTQKVSFFAPSVPAVGSDRYNIDKAIFEYIAPFLQVILLMFSGFWFVRLFKR